MSFADALRRDLADRAQKYAQAETLPHCVSYGDAPIACFEPYERGSRHGNFLQESYKAILATPGWRRRLAKVHAQGRRSLPHTERGLWMELDSCTSSDALLMNIFCHPNASREGRISALLGAEPGVSPCFGYKARVPLSNGRFDRTEVDLRLGNLLIEAKLTESDFRSADKRVLLAYRVRRKRQRLPASLLIENASDRNPARPQSLPEAFPIKASDGSSRIVWIRCTPKKVFRAGAIPRSIVKWTKRQDIILPGWRRLPSWSGRG